MNCQHKTYTSEYSGSVIIHSCTNCPYWWMTAA